jgi:hypothetical protein
MRSGKDQFAVYLSEELARAGKIVSVDKFAQDLKDGCAYDFADLARVMNGMADSLSAAVTGFSSYHFSQDQERGLVNALNKEIDQFRISTHNWYEDKTPITRSILQIYGTEIFRDRVSESHWVDRLYKRITNLNDNSDNEVVIVTDTRFPNELDTFTKEYLGHNGVMAHSVMVQRDVGIVDNHSSENSLDGYECFNYMVDNAGTLQDLRAVAIAIAKDILNPEDC